MSHTLTLEELVRHPEITNVIVKHEPRRCGAAFVALERGGPISIACVFGAIIPRKKY
jgi:hypothetical protein